MNIAVLSDIHGNYVALQECINYAMNNKIDTFIFLGDYVGELAYPKKTMEILYSLSEKYKCYFVKGNKEDYWIDYKKNGEIGWLENDSTTGSLYYTYHNLSKKDLDFFEALPIKMEIEFEDLKPITICHGSPLKVNEKLLPENENTFSIMERNENNYILCGHTHIQGIIVHAGKVVLNSGSVGVSLHGNGKAQFMILHGTSEHWDYEFVSLTYDVEKVIKELHTSGLYEKSPYWCKVSENLLRTGETPHGTVLAKAMAICKQKYGECTWPNVPEECWEQAVKEMIERCI